jgi:hypothetical protein
VYFYLGTDSEGGGGCVPQYWLGSIPPLPQAYDERRRAKDAAREAAEAAEEAAAAAREAARRAAEDAEAARWMGEISLDEAGDAGAEAAVDIAVRATLSNTESRRRSIIPFLVGERTPALHPRRALPGRARHAFYAELHSCSGADRSQELRARRGARQLARGP